MTRRLNIDSSCASTVEQQLRAVERWSQSFENIFPDAEATRGHAHWHMPVDQALTDPATSGSDVQRRCAQAVIDGAAAMSVARPPAKAHMRVAALICLPDLFMSQICLFSDPRYFRNFANRTHSRQCWTPVPSGHRLSVKLELTIPNGFIERGFHERLQEPDETDASRLVVTYEGEVWMIADADPKQF